MSERKEKLKRLVEISPAFDKRHSEPSKNYGIRGVDLRMIVQGKKGATQFVLYTNWHLPHVTKEMQAKPITSDIDIKVRFLPLPTDVGWHSLEPQYEGQASRDECPYLNNKPCYYDGSGLMANEMFNVLCAEGSDGVWKRLEENYREMFEAKCTTN